MVPKTDLECIQEWNGKDKVFSEGKMGESLDERLVKMEVIYKGSRFIDTREGEELSKT